MVSDLSKLVDLLEPDSLPQWMRRELESKREEILQALDSRGEFVLGGPNGEQVTITVKGKTPAAA